MDSQSKTAHTTFESSKELLPEGVELESGAGTSAKSPRFDTTTSPGTVDGSVLARLQRLEEKQLDRRFDAAALLGEGGMGEIRLHKDRHIGRDVAVKTIRKDRQHPEAIQRFLREARVQGQLEHPAIVPVYDLGVGSDGAPFFVMKRVRGRTLEEVVEHIQKGDQETIDRFSRRRLLDLFARACRAIEFAHARGVIHRDLKPANIMFGGFGEVYVLDWGVAKVRGVDDEPAALHITGENPGLATVSGNVVGTPAYMAPEQFRGEEADERADVFSLGTILFEILTGHLFYGKGGIIQLANNVLNGIDPSIAKRFPYLVVPPELEQIVIEACTFDRNARLASAKDFAQRLEAYLEGDRNLAARKKAAEEHVARARSLLQTDGKGGTVKERAEAVREVSRALALNPSSNEAFQVLVEVIESPPEVIPEELGEELAAISRENSRSASFAATFAYASWFLYVPFYLYLGVRNMPVLVGVTAAMTGASLLSFINYKRDQAGSRLPFWAPVCCFVGLALLSQVVGGIFFIPGSLVAAFLAYSMNHPRTRFAPAALLALATCLLPPLLEWSGFLPPTVVAENGRLAILPNLLSFEKGRAVLAFVLVSNAGLVVTFLFYARLIRKRLRVEIERSAVRNWYLKHLLPLTQKHGRSLVPGPDSSQRLPRAED